MTDEIKTPMTIIAAAIKERGSIFTGRRHHEIIRAIVDGRGRSEGPVYGEQGFLASDGRFVSREEAAKIAFEAGQIPAKVTWLFSEDVFDSEAQDP